MCRRGTYGGAFPSRAVRVQTQTHTQCGPAMPPLPPKRIYLAAAGTNNSHCCSCLLQKEVGRRAAFPLLLPTLLKTAPIQSKPTAEVSFRINTFRQPRVASIPLLQVSNWMALKKVHLSSHLSLHIGILFFVLIVKSFSESIEGHSKWFPFKLHCHLQEGTGKQKQIVTQSGIPPSYYHHASI